MKTHTIALSFATVLSLSVLGGCAIMDDSGGGASQVNDMMGWIERVHVESELAKQKMQASCDMMNSLLEGNYKGDRQTAFQEFVRAVQNSQEQAETLRTALREMQAAAQPVFDQWSEDLLKMSNQQMRRRSESRYEANLLKYQSLVSAAKSTENSYDAFNQGTRDLSLFLNNDLNPAAMTEVREDAREVTSLAIELDGRFQRSLTAAREYLSIAGGELAMPEPGAMPPGGAAEEVRGSPPPPPGRR